MTENHCQPAQVIAYGEGSIAAGRDVLINAPPKIPAYAHAKKRSCQACPGLTLIGVDRCSNCNTNFKTYADNERLNRLKKNQKLKAEVEWQFGLWAFGFFFLGMGIAYFDLLRSVGIVFIVCGCLIFYALGASQNDAEKLEIEKLERELGL